MAKRFHLLLVALLLTAGLASAQQVVIRVAPPRPRAEVRVVAPGPGYVWIGGYHEWRGSAYAWVPGRWERPPYPRARWIRPHYRHVHGGWVFVPGHWQR